MMLQISYVIRPISSVLLQLVNSLDLRHDINYVRAPNLEVTRNGMFAVLGGFNALVLDDPVPNVNVRPSEWRV